MPAVDPLLIRSHRIALALAVILLLGTVLSAAEQYGMDLSGNQVTNLSGPGVRLVVLVFAASDCPISNRYVPEIARLSREFVPRGVRFWWVFPNPGDTAAVVAQHNRDFSIREDTVLDTRQTLVRLAQATTTPEAAVFAAEKGSFTRIYRGRIDDRYLAIGEERPQPGTHDLEAAISAALIGKPIARPVGPPVGCSIVSLGR